MSKNKTLLNQRSNEELMEMYALGSYDAFEVIYDRYSRRVYNYFSSKIKNNHDSEELSQLLFLKMHSSKHLFSNKYKFEQWLFVIAKTVLIDFLRKSKKFSMDVSLIELDFYAFQANGSDDSNRQELNLESLNAKENDLLKLRYEDELSFKEIAERLSQSEVSLRKFFSRTLKKLQAKNGV